MTTRRNTVVPKVTARIPTAPERVKEILKCAGDPKYFINRYVKIAHPMKGMMPFKTFDFQDECIDSFLRNKHVIVNKSRQLGLSTVSAAYALWMALFQRERNVLVIATRLDVARLFTNKVRTMLQGLPEWLVVPTLTTDTAKELGFSNGSRVKAVPTGKDAGRGEALSLLVLDEAAHIENVEELWLGLRPALSTGGSSIVISTPSGVGNLFHNLWVGANNDENEFVPIELPWSVHPERDQQWFDTERQTLLAARGEQGVAMELLCSFRSSGDTFLKADAMDRLFEAILEPVRKDTVPGVDDQPNIWIWKEPILEHRYVIGADVARGTGKDFSTCFVVDTSTDEAVAEYRAKVVPDRFAEVLVYLGRLYHTALICPELNAVGMVTAHKLKELAYPNLYYEKLQRNMYMSYTAHDVKDLVPGVELNVKNRLEMLAKLENVLRSRKLLTYSKRLHEELQTFVWKGNKPQASKGYHDDLVMALALTSNLYEPVGTTDHSGRSLAMAMLAGTSVSTKTLRGDEKDSSQLTRFQPAISTTSRSPGIMHQHRLATMKNAQTHNYQDPYWQLWRGLWDK